MGWMLGCVLARANSANEQAISATPKLPHYSLSLSIKIFHFQSIIQFVAGVYVDSILFLEVGQVIQPVLVLVVDFVDVHAGRLTLRLL